MNHMHENHFRTWIKLTLFLMVGSITRYTKTVVIVNDTKGSKYVELYTRIDDHVWMRQHNSYKDAPMKRIPLFRAQMVSRDILTTRPFFLKDLTVKVSWGKKNINQYEQDFILAESNALEGDPVPQLFTDHHVIRLTNQTPTQIKAELLYLPHGKHYLRTILGKQRAQEKHQQ